MIYDGGDRLLKLRLGDVSAGGTGQAINDRRIGFAVYHETSTEYALHYRQIASSCRKK
jgi:hypothetical protein